MLDSPLNTEMRCTLLTNAHGDIVILHDKSLKAEVEWVEFHDSELTFTIVYQDGIMQPLGIKIEPKIAQNISKGTKVQFALVEDKKMVSVQKTSIVIQDY